VQRGGVFMGLKVSCDYCGSNRWYSLNDLRDKINCKGCNKEIMPNIDSKIYYSVSDIIINNLLNDRTKNGKEFDGNYIVAKTLHYLKYKFGDTGGSFLWCPPLDFMTKSGMSTDLDIVAVKDGKLIIGEAKSNASEFSNKVINNIVWLANNLLPDIIIVACNTGNLSPTVEKIKKLITNSNCEIMSYVASKPWYHFSGIFGFPHEEDV
jgi:hypothetical protein